MRTPHPLEAQRRRPRAEAIWLPRRGEIVPALPPRPMVEGWRKPSLRAGPNAGMVRINFTYRNAFTTCAGFSDKARRPQYLEGPHEGAAWRVYEMDPDYSDLQFQPIALSWVRNSGPTKIYTLDVMLETSAGDLIVEEWKADDRHFEDPETRDLLAAAEEALEVHGIKLRRRSGRRFDDVALRLVRAAFDERRTSFAADDVKRVQDSIHRDGGSAPLGRILESLAHPICRKQPILHAMMRRRLVGFDLGRPPMPDTPVHIPLPPARPGALRAFLHEHAVDRDDDVAN